MVSYEESGYAIVQYFNKPNMTAPQAFHEAYSERAGKAPTYEAAGAMAQCYALQGALALSFSLDANDVMTALGSLFQPSFYGRLTFAYNGQDILKRMVVYQ